MKSVLHTSKFKAWKQLLAAAMLSAVSLAAWADSPVTGATLYATYCQSCHGAASGTSNKIDNGRNARTVIDAAIAGVGSMTSLRSSFPSGGSNLADIFADAFT